MAYAQGQSAFGQPRNAQPSAAAPGGWAYLFLVHIMYLRVYIYVFTCIDMCIQIVIILVGVCVV